jgi:hypothetical protein
VHTDEEVKRLASEADCRLTADQTLVEGAVSVATAVAITVDVLDP